MHLHHVCLKEHFFFGTGFAGSRTFAPPNTPVTAPANDTTWQTNGVIEHNKLRQRESTEITTKTTKVSDRAG
jgi:hypothetical protein